MNLKALNINIISLFLLLCSAHSIHGQELRLYDKSTNLPVVGASVYVQEEAQTYLSNEKGVVQFAIYGEKTFSISHIGYLPADTMILFTSENAIHRVNMTSINQQLDEIYVYDGYRKISQRERIGSFDKIDASKLQERTGVNVLDRLDGMLSGVMFDKAQINQNTGSNLRVRGLSTINGNSQPLIILDDFPYEGDITNIDPNSIENITVLKDAAATSIWGARAGNGVIVITTSKAELDRPTRISFISNLSVQERPDLRYANTMDAASFIEFEKELFEKGFYNSKFNLSSRPGLTPVVEMLGQHRAGNLTDTELEEGSERLKAQDLYKDLEKFVYRNGMTEQSHVSLSGGGGQYGWFLGLGHNTGKDELDLRQSRFSLNTSQKIGITDWVEGTLGLTYTEQGIRSGKDGVRNFSNSQGDVYPYAQLADQEGVSLPLVRFLRQSYLEELDYDYLQDWQYYPLENHKYHISKNKIREFLVAPALRFKLPKGIGADVRYMYQRQMKENTTEYKKESFYTRDLINRYTQINNGTAAYPIPLGDIFDESYPTFLAHNFRSQLDYMLRKANFIISSFMGFEMRKSTTSSTSNRLYGFNADRYTNIAVNYAAPYPSFVNGVTSFIPSNDGKSRLDTRYLSYYGNVSGTYKDRYGIIGSFRKDASNFFGMKANRKWNPLWSVGGTWEVSKEPFYRSDFFPYLKMRTSYGLSGNLSNNMVAVTTVVYRPNSPYTGEEVAAIGNYENPELQWETVKTWNVGLDFATRSNRITGSLEYYIKRGENLFGTTPMDYTAGIGTSIIKNVASMKGQGIDLNLSSQNLTGRVEWNTHLLFSYNKDEITDYYMTNNYGNNFVGSTLRVSGIVGKPVYSMLSYRWAGLANEDGRPLGYLNGEISENYSSLTGTGTLLDDLYYHGPTSPRFFGALSNSFQFAGLSLDIRLSFKLDYFLRRSTISYYNLVQNNVTHRDYNNRWQMPGDEKSTDIPAFIYPASLAMSNFYTNAQPFVYNGSFVRLENIKLGYDLSQASFWKTDRLKIRCYLIAENLGLLWRKNILGLDPQRGRQALGVYPVPAVYTFGVNLNL